MLTARVVLAFAIVFSIELHCHAEQPRIFGTEVLWKYFDDAVEPPAEWKELGFDDGRWNAGNAPLGYGDTGLSTIIDFGESPENKHRTAYFRHILDVEDPNVEQLQFLIRSDDGFVLSINGEERIRHNLPAGRISYESLASAAKGGFEERFYQRFTLPASVLKQGKNIIAVEVHQCDPASSDLFFDLAMRSQTAEQFSKVAVLPRANRAAHQYREDHRVSVLSRIADGYLDGGRGMILAEDGKAQSRRELIRVDRRQDYNLVKHLKYASSKRLSKIPELERATLLALYVDRVMSPIEGRQYAQIGGAVMAGQYANHTVLLGDVRHLGGGGVCRHRALLFKMMADEAGLKVALVRGNLGAGDQIGGHAWNELHLPDGRKLLVDITNPLPGFHFPELGGVISRNYLTVRNRRMYPVENPSAL